MIHDAVKRQPPLVPESDTTNGSDFGLGQPDLALGSTVTGACVAFGFVFNGP